MTLASLAAATHLLSRIEELAADATGALLFTSNEDPVGSILLEGGRICWIAARGLGRRLTDLLAERSGGSGAPPSRRSTAIAAEPARPSARRS